MRSGVPSRLPYFHQPDMTAHGRILVVGVDGGGTKTAACVVDLDSGRVLGSAQAGCSNKNSVGLDGACAAILQALEGAAGEAGATLDQVSAVCACLSGVDTDSDAAEVSTQLRALLPQKVQVWVHNDAVAALCAGTDGALEGCVLIAGTGTICYGSSAGGASSARSAGWGGAFLDGGSGYDLGQRALAAVARAADGRGPLTALTAAVCEACGVHSSQPDGLLRWAYADTTWSRLAALARNVLSCADGGDGVAGQILDAAAQELAGSVQAVWRRLGFGEGTAVVLAGGLLEHQGGYASRVEAALQAVLPGARLVRADRTAAEGAALLACKQFGACEWAAV